MMNAGKKLSSSLFSGCHLAIVVNHDLTSNQAIEMSKTLEIHGGEAVQINVESDTDIDGVTHIISATTDFIQYPVARDRMIPVMKPSWVTQSLLRNKQAPLRPYNPDPKLIFSNVTLTCADIPTGDKDAIIGAVLVMGGLESSSFTKTTTHVCALSADHPKSQEALTKYPKCRVVLPHWFDDCLRLGRRIDERPYLLPDPEIFRLKPEDKLPFPPSSSIIGATSPRPINIPISRDDPIMRRLNVFKNRNVMLADDLVLGDRLRGIIDDLVRGGGGSVTASVHEADIYVCQYREGRDYIFASRAGIDVGNLSWLYILISQNEWTSPLRRLLHYPLPKDGIPGFEKYKITLSNYAGDARLYLENLVLAAGAEFTKSMKQENTHLITARNSSEKCTAAEEWNINMINHLWLEESYARCGVQKLTDPRYTHFPPRTNLGEIIGQIEMDPEILEAKYFPKDPTPCPGDPFPPRRSIMHDRDRNAKVSEIAALNDGGGRTSKHTMSSAKRRSRLYAVAGIATPVSDRRRSTGKENETPSTGSRSAKDKAISKIHDLAPDIAEYERENKRKGSVWGGDRAASRVEREQSLAGGSSPMGEDLSEVPDGEDRSAIKRLKISKTKSCIAPKNLPPVEIRLLVTGFEGWLGNPVKEDLDKKKLRDLGVMLTQDASHCTHIAAPAMVRTKKFLCGLTAGPVLVSTEFIDACIKSTKLPAVDRFLLKDVKNEKKFNIRLKDVVARAKTNRHHLLTGVPIYCTPDIENGSETFKAIVDANGGSLLLYRGRGGAMIKPTDPDDDEYGPEPVYLLTSQKPSDRQLWPKFEDMAKAGNMIPRIVHSEWLLDTAMSQEMVWNDVYLATQS